MNFLTVPVSAGRAHVGSQSRSRHPTNADTRGAGHPRRGPRHRRPEDGLPFEVQGRRADGLAHAADRAAWCGQQVRVVAPSDAQAASGERSAFAAAPRPDQLDGPRHRQPIGKLNDDPCRALRPSSRDPACQRPRRLLRADLAAVSVPVELGFRLRRDGLGDVSTRPRAWDEISSLLRGQWEDGLVPQIVFHAPSDDYFPGPEVWQTNRNARRPPASPSRRCWRPPHAACTTMARRTVRSARRAWPRSTRICCATIAGGRRRATPSAAAWWRRCIRGRPGWTTRRPGTPR